MFPVRKKRILCASTSIPMKKPKLTPHHCSECDHPEIHQWFNNPLIAVCPKRKMERFPASAFTSCPFFKPANVEKPVIHHSSYADFTL